MTYCLREHINHEGKYMAVGSFMVAEVCSWDFLSLILMEKETEWPESGAELSIVKSYPQNSLPLTSPYLLKVPQFSKTVASVEGQVFKDMGDSSYSKHYTK